MLCPNCQQPIDDRAAACMYCGASFVQPTPAADPVEAMPIDDGNIQKKSYLPIILISCGVGVALIIALVVWYLFHIGFGAFTGPLADVKRGVYSLTEADSIHMELVAEERGSYSKASVDAVLALDEETPTVTVLGTARNSAAADAVVNTIVVKDTILYNYSDQSGISEDFSNTAVTLDAVAALTQAVIDGDDIDPADYPEGFFDSLTTEQLNALNDSVGDALNDEAWLKDHLGFQVTQNPDYTEYTFKADDYKLGNAVAELAEDTLERSAYAALLQELERERGSLILTSNTLTIRVDGGEIIYVELLRRDATEYLSLELTLSDHDNVTIEEEQLTAAIQGYQSHLCRSCGQSFGSHGGYCYTCGKTVFGECSECLTLFSEDGLCRSCGAVRVDCPVCRSAVDDTGFCGTCGTVTKHRCPDCNTLLQDDGHCSGCARVKNRCPDCTDYLSNIGYCRTCKQEKLRCPDCRSYLRTDGYCSYCDVVKASCPDCGDKMNAGGYCSGCDETKRACSDCNTLLRKDGYCSKCAAVKPACPDCVIGRLGNNGVCNICHTQKQRCQRCGQFLPEGGFCSRCQIEVACPDCKTYLSVDYTCLACGYDKITCPDCDGCLSSTGFCAACNATKTACPHCDGYLRTDSYCPTCREQKFECPECLGFIRDNHRCDICGGTFTKCGDCGNAYLSLSGYCDGCAQQKAACPDCDGYVSRFGYCDICDEQKAECPACDNRYLSSDGDCDSCHNVYVPCNDCHSGLINSSGFCHICEEVKSVCFACGGWLENGNPADEWRSCPHCGAVVSSPTTTVAPPEAE